MPPDHLIMPGSAWDVQSRASSVQYTSASKVDKRVGETLQSAPELMQRDPASAEFPREDAVLRLILEGTASETGHEFFRSLVKNMALAMDTSGAWVTEYLPRERRLRALAFWHRDAFIEHFEYPVEGTPCGVAINTKGLAHFTKNVVELFPDDPDLPSMNAVSYMGVPLLDAEGEVIGHLAVLDEKPLPRNPRLVALFEIFAARAAAEQRRLKAEQLSQAQQERLTRLLESTLDAILVLDEEWKIVELNPAAERLFGCTREDLFQEPIREFLAPECAGNLTAWIQKLEQSTPGQQQLWLPKDFQARRWDHSTFPAEATLSRFRNRDRTFHTMILRNLDERLEAERQIQWLRQETEFLRKAVRDLPDPNELLGGSAGMRTVVESIHQVAATDSTVLITGETGTGKELVARAIHQNSSRSRRPLITVNCAAIPANLMESELFGHERGAFTGANTRREGRCALADQGTLFLDEVGELPLELQPKLLRFLQEGTFESLGSTKTIHVDVRVIAATHRDLKSMVTRGEFREDLFFRLHVFPIQIPPLRERSRDIEILANTFAQRYAREMGKRVDNLSPSQLQRLREYAWPGNVRELQNVIERALILASSSNLPVERAMLHDVPHNATSPAPPPQSPQSRILTAAEMQEFERSNLIRALEQSQWKIAGNNGAARLLNVPPSTLASRIKSLGITKRDR